MVLLLFSILFITTFFFYHLYYKRRGLPPGPTPLPIVGNLLQIWSYGAAEKAFLAWRRRYGPVYTYWMGADPVVCVADYQKMVDTFVKDGDAYAGRFTMIFEDVLKKSLGRDGQGIIGSSGYKWREQRRFALHVLRDFGLGKNTMQERILDELDTLFGKINAKMDKSTTEKEEEINLDELLDVAVGSIINSVIFGYRLVGEKETEFWEIKRLLAEHMHSFSEISVVIWLLYPDLLSRIPPFSIGGNRMIARLKHIGAFFERRIGDQAKELEQSGAWDEPPRDFVDAFLKEMRRRTKEGSENGATQNGTQSHQNGAVLAGDQQHHYFNLDMCTNVCLDLWIAGQETTTTTLAWGIAYLLHNEQCMRKLQEELDTMIGSTDRMITVADKSKLLYTNAVVNEIQRTANLLPINIAHGLMQDVQLDGYDLPKGTCVMPQISAVLADEKYFPDPDQFSPERYLDGQGKLKRYDELIPFSIGKRQCLGESLARMELFLFVANLFNQYNISPGKLMPSLKRTNGFIAICKPYTCKLEKRRPMTT